MVSSALGKFWSALIRTKPVNRDAMTTPLNRCLNTFDLILIGVGNMSGAGIYVLTGTVVRRKAGPATCLAYFIAGVTAFLNGLCYSELGSRVPRAGSAYSYTYVAMGEFLAFIIGWSIILEYVLSASSIARGFSGILDAMTSGAISNWTTSHVGTFYHTSPNSTAPPLHHIISYYPDLVSVLLIIVVAIILSLGANLSKHFNTVTTSINVIVLLFATGVMFAMADLANWTGQPFMPFSFSGVLSGAATCFYAFIGFDAISVSTEEALTPQKSLPIATGVSVLLVSVLLVLSSASITLFEPWYLIDVKAAFTAAFASHGLHWAEIITGVGAITGIIAALYCNNYAMPRVVYAMATDGLIFRQLAYVTPLTQVPIVAIAFSSFIAAVLALLLDIEALADFLSIGTLIAYSIVACNVLVLRYTRPPSLASAASTPALNSPTPPPPMSPPPPAGGADEDSSLPLKSTASTMGRLKEPFRGIPVLKSMSPGLGPILALLVFICGVMGSCLLVKLGLRQLASASPIVILPLVLFCLITLLSFGAMLLYEQDIDIDTFKVPAVPLIPCVAVMLNVILIMQLQAITWLRFLIWLLIGLVIYFAYGMHQSNENPDRLQQESEKVPLASSMSYQKLPEASQDAASSKEGEIKEQK